MSLVYLDNPDWNDDPMPWADGWEPWEPDECDAVEGACCEYCGTVENIRDLPEPFGRRQCCEGCFNVLLGGDDPVIPAAVLVGFVWGAWQLAREIAEYRRVR